MTLVNFYLATKFSNFLSKPDHDQVDSRAEHKIMPYLQMHWKNHREKIFHLESILVNEQIEYELSLNSKEIVMGLSSHGKFVSLGNSLLPLYCSLISSYLHTTYFDYPSDTAHKY